MKDIVAAIALVGLLWVAFGWDGGVRGAYPALSPQGQRATAVH